MRNKIIIKDGTVYYFLNDLQEGGWIYPNLARILIMGVRGGSSGGGGVLGVLTPPPPFWGTPKLHKEGKKRCTLERENAAF